jgi:hypothetical protein
MSMASPNSRVWWAFLIAPLVSVPALALAMATVVGVTEPPAGTDIVAGALHVTPFLALGLPLAYALALTIGLPTFLLLRRKGQLRLLPILIVTALLGGLGVAAALGLMLNRWDWQAFLLGVPVGSSVGATFWFLGVRGQSSVRTA